MSTRTKVWRDIALTLVVLAVLQGVMMAIDRSTDWPLLLVTAAVLVGIRLITGLRAAPRRSTRSITGR